MLFDTHAHYDDERFDADRDALLASMPEKNVGLIVNPGCDLPTSRMAVALAEKFDFVYAAVGIHPENCGDFVPEQIDTLQNLAKNPRVVAIGEIGLDYYWAENPPKERQMELFRQQVRSQQLFVLLYRAGGSGLWQQLTTPRAAATVCAFSGPFRIFKHGFFKSYNFTKGCVGIKLYTHIESRIKCIKLKVSYLSK